MKGVIIINYQVMGKSCGGKEKCIDLESRCFWVGNTRSDDWYIPYCKTAMGLANQGFTVFTSSHKAVRDYLSSMPLLPNVGKVVVFYPDPKRSKEWVKRLQKRYDKTGKHKDYLALMNAKDCCEENIQEILNSGLPVYQPAWHDYDLMNYVHKIRYDWCFNTVLNTKV